MKTISDGWIGFVKDLIWGLKEWIWFGKGWNQFVYGWIEFKSWVTHKQKHMQ